MSKKQKIEWKNEFLNNNAIDTSFDRKKESISNYSRNMNSLI